jgi:hypothetical protein
VRFVCVHLDENIAPPALQRPSVRVQQASPGRRQADPVGSTTPKTPPPPKIRMAPVQALAGSSRTVLARIWRLIRCSGCEHRISRVHRIQILMDGHSCTTKTELRDA